MTLHVNANYLIIYKAKAMYEHVFNVGIVVFVVMLITYTVLAYSTNHVIDTTLLLLSASALTWTYFKSHYHSLEGFQSDKAIKTTTLRENYTSISKDLVQYFSVFDDRSYIDGKTTWSNIVKIIGFDCDTKLQLTKAPKFYVQTGIELGGNSLIGPLSNTMNIRFGNPYTICFAVTMKQLLSASPQDTIELFKMYANSSNNNGISLYLTKSSIDTSNGANAGSLYIQFADNKPTLCKLTKEDNKINFPQNTLLFFVIVREANKVRLLLVSERTDKIEEIANISYETKDITFSNKELVFNRFGNWNANIFNMAVFNNSLDDIRVTQYYMYIKDLYTKYNNPAYLDALKKYLDSLDAYKTLKTCPFPKEVCSQCSTVKDWSNFQNIIDAPLTCKKAIAKYCSSNPKHPFCECWNTTSPKYSSTTCTLLRALYANNKNDVCQSVCKVPPEQSLLSALKYNSEYTFDKIKIKYPYDDLPPLLEKQSSDKQYIDMQQPVETQTFIQKIASWFS
jgi:hypothetical protein